MNRRNIANLVLALPVLVACNNDNARAMIGQQSPKLTAKSIDGSFIYFGELPRPTVVHFFGLWCGPCLEEMPAWQDTIRQIKALNEIDIVQFHLGAVPAQHKDIYTWSDGLDEDIHTTMILDEARELGNQFQAYGTPSTILIDKNQIIVDHYWSLASSQTQQRLIAKAKNLITEA